MALLYPACHGQAHDSAPFLSCVICDLRGPPGPVIVTNHLADLALDGLVERAVSSTYLGACCRPLGRLVPPPLAGRAVAVFFLILSPSPHRISRCSRGTRERRAARITVGLNYTKVSCTGEKALFFVSQWTDEAALCTSHRGLATKERRLSPVQRGRRDRTPTTTKGGLSLWSALCIVSWLPSSILLSTRNRNTGMIIDGTRARKTTIFRKGNGFSRAAPQ